MEFMIFVLFAVAIVVKVAAALAKRDQDASPPLWGGRPARRRAARPPEQTPQPQTLEEALELAEDRPAPPPLRFGAVTDPETERRTSAKDLPEREDLSAIPVAPDALVAAPASGPDDTADSAGIVGVLIAETGSEPESSSSPGAGSAEYSASSSVYTPTSVYTGCTATMSFSGEYSGGAGQEIEMQDEAITRRADEDPSPGDPASQDPAACA